jgi:hypothetical protein
MSFTVISPENSPAPLPQYYRTTEPDEENKTEKIVFVKPHPDGFCFVSTCEDNGEICINHAYIESPENKSERIIEFCRQNKIRHLRYDSSVFMQEGKAIREALPDMDVFLYKPRQNLIDRIIAQSDFIDSNFIFEEESNRTEEYNRFMSILDGYNSGLAYEYRRAAQLPKEAYNIAMDILSDVAKHYRRNVISMT